MATIAMPIKITLRPGLTLWQPSGSKIEFDNDGPNRFVAHFANPHVLGMEFAVIGVGSNVFALRTTEKTPCYIWSEAELALGLVNWESLGGVPSSGPTEAAGPVRPMLPPIIIPPGL